MKNCPSKLAILSIICLSFLLSTCDNSLEPLDKERGLYSIYGVLEINNDVNYIRVKDLNIPLVADTLQSIDANVTLENLTNNASEVLRDSLVEFDGVLTHNFESHLNIQSETPYKVTVKNPKGAKVTSKAVTPGITSASVSPQPSNCLPKDFDNIFTVKFDSIKAGETVLLSLFLEYKNKEFHSPEVRAIYNKDSNTARYIYDLKATIKRNLDPTFDQPGYICPFITSDSLAVNYRHFGVGLLDRETSESIKIPGGTGNFVGVEKGFVSFKIIH